MTRNTLFYSIKYLNSTSKAMYFLLCTETNKTLFEILTKQFVFVPLIFVTITIILGSFFTWVVPLCLCSSVWGTPLQDLHWPSQADGIQDRQYSSTSLTTKTTTQKNFRAFHYGWVSLQPCNLLVCTYSIIQEILQQILYLAELYTTLNK